jgi:hypothetical protein
MICFLKALAGAIYQPKPTMGFEPMTSSLPMKYQQLANTLLSKARTVYLKARVVCQVVRPSFQPILLLNVVLEVTF